jgi:hypothetical protein
VNYEQDGDAAIAADRMPAFFLFHHAIPLRDDV